MEKIVRFDKKHTINFSSHSQRQIGNIYMLSAQVSRKRERITGNEAIQPPQEDLTLHGGGKRKNQISSFTRAI